MMRNRGCSVISISSVVGLAGNAGQTNYAASKAGIVGFTKSFAKEFASRNMRANVVAAGYITNEMTGVLRDDVLQSIKQNTPLRREGEADEVDGVVEFMYTDVLI